MSITLYDFTYAAVTVPIQAKPYLDKIWKPIDMKLFTDGQYEDAGRSNDLFMDAMYLNEDTNCFDILSTEAVLWINKLREDNIPHNAYGFMVEDNLLFDESYTNGRSLATLVHRDKGTTYTYTMEQCTLDLSALMHLTVKETNALLRKHKDKYQKYIDLIAFSERDIKNLYIAMTLHIIES